MEQTVERISINNEGSRSTFNKGVSWAIIKTDVRYCAKTISPILYPRTTEKMLIIFSIICLKSPAIVIGFKKCRQPQACALKVLF